MSFFSYIESVISSLNFRHTEFNEFIEIVTFNVVNRLRHYRDDGIEDDIPLMAKKTPLMECMIKADLGRMH